MKKNVAVLRSFFSVAVQRGRAATKRTTVKVAGLPVVLYALSSTVRTTIDLKPEHRNRLLELAVRRGEKGLSSVIADAVEFYLQSLAERDPLRRRALDLCGRISASEAERLRSMFPGFASIGDDGGRARRWPSACRHRRLIAWHAFEQDRL